MKVLIIGASGFLGKKIMKIFSSDFEAYGTTHSKRLDSLYNLDITNRDKVIELLKKLKLDIVIHAAGITNVDRCEIDKKEAFRINVEGTRNIVDACKRINAKLVYISTDYIFDGEKGNYKEEDKANPINNYGKNKYDGEVIVKEGLDDYIITRSSVLYGYNDENDKNTFTKWVINNLKERKKINVVTDQIVSTTLIDDIAEGIKILIKKNRKGIFHLAGAEAASRYYIAKKIAKIFDLDESLLNPIITDKLKQIAKRPKNSSLDISKAKKEGIVMSNIEEGLKKMKSQMSA